MAFRRGVEDVVVIIVSEFLSIWGRGLKISVSIPLWITVMFFLATPKSFAISFLDDSETVTT